MPIAKEQSTQRTKYTLGEYLANLRATKGITLREVEEEATDHDVSSAYISQLTRKALDKAEASRFPIRKGTDHYYQ